MVGLRAVGGTSDESSHSSASGGIMVCSAS